MNNTQRNIERYIDNQKYQNALDACNEALASNPNDESIIYWRYIANYMLENYEEVICDLDDLVKRHPNCPEVYNNRGTAKTWLGLYEAAKADFTLAIELNPQLYEAYVGRINVLTNLDELEAAKADCNYLITNGNYLDIIYTHQAYIELKMKHYDEAKHCCEQALQYNPRQIWAYLHRSTILISASNLHEEQYKAAMDDCIKAIEIDSNCPIPYFNMGICLYHLNDRKSAYECYQKALAKIQIYKETSFIHQIEICDIYLRIAQLFPLGNDRSSFFKEAYERVLNNWNKDDSSKIYLYKYKAFKSNYLNDENKIFEKTIADGTVWFSDFIKLNDPRDGYVIQQIEGLPSEVDLKGFRELSFACECDFKNVDQEETMWGYYADGGNGVCFMYELNVSELWGKPYGFSNVRYIHRTPSINNTFCTRDFINARLFTKTPRWAHEHEARIITYDHGYIDHSCGISICAESIGLKLVKIRFGCRCNNEKIDFIKELVKKNPKLEVKFSKIVHNEDILGNGELQEVNI